MIKKDLRIEFYKSSGPGGQHKNKRFMAVRITHVPTGLVAIGQEYRSQTVNKEVALARLVEKLKKLNRPVKTRIATKASRQAKQRHLDWKKKHAVKKQARRERFEDRE